MERPGATLQTLERGLVALAHVAHAAEGASVADIARVLAVHRAIAYRIVATLEKHGMLVRAGDGRLFLGAAIPALAERFMPQFRVQAGSVLRDLAQQSGATAFLAQAEGEACVAIMVAEPEGNPIRVGYRVGSRHPLDRGAAGIAILSGRPPAAGEADAVRAARADGFSHTRGQLQAGAVGVASPVPRPAGARWPEMSVGLVAMEDLDVDRAAERVRRAAIALGELFAGRARA